jgi:nucleotide-binding universal stress UspA family protein
MPATGDKLDLNFETVVYATDFSLSSQNAGAYAAKIAAHFAARLLVAHSFTLSQAAMEVEADKVQVSEQRRDLKTLLSRKAALLKSEAVDAIPILLEGDPGKAIPDLAEEYAPALIVLGTHGGGCLEREFIGSSAEEILRSTRWPSLTVGPHVRPLSTAAFPFKRILVATDFTPEAAQACAYAIHIAEAMDAEINVLHVVHDHDIDNHERLADLQERFSSSLDGLVQKDTKYFCHPKTYVAAGRAHDRILGHIDERSINLLVLGIQHASHISMEMRTSGAFQIIVDAKCPVMTIRR